MTQLATPSDLASYLQQDIDTSTANLALSLASALFEKEADTKFASTANTFLTEGWGQNVLALPKHPVIAVSEARIDATAIASTEYSLVGQNLYRLAGWGGRTWHPQKVEVDYTYGYTAVPDDVRAAVVESAAQAYANPDQLVRMQIDDYSEQRNLDAGGAGLTSNATKVARLYRIGGFA